MSGRLLTVRKAGSCGKAAPKRHEQPDYQATGCWKAPTSGNLNSSSPGLFLLQKRQQGEQAAAVGGSGSSQDSGSEGEDDVPPASSSGSSSRGLYLSHTRPRKGAAAVVDVVAALRPLLGYDLRHSQQVSEGLRQRWGRGGALAKGVCWCGGSSSTWAGVGGGTSFLPGAGQNSLPPVGHFLAKEQQPTPQLASSACLPACLP